MVYDTQFLNVILVGIAFFFTFSAFLTMGNIEETIIRSISRDDPSFTASGYTSLSIIYVFFSISNWFAPSIIAVIGSKWSMFLASITYLVFVSSFFWPATWLLYTVSVIVGMGAALLWTSNGTYLTLNSNVKTIHRNVGVFWAIFQCSMLSGNIFIFFTFNDQEYIKEQVRSVVVTVLSVMAIGGILMFLFLPKPPKMEDASEEERYGPLQEFKEALHLFITPRMLMLSAMTIYTGIELVFWSAVYGTAVGATLQLGDSKKFVGLTGVFVGVGEVVGGSFFGILGKTTVNWGRDRLVIAAYIIHIIAFIGIFLNLPNESSLKDTNDEALVKTSVFLIMACSFLLGLGDACLETQIYSFLGIVYSKDSAPAFAIYKFVQSLAAAVAFEYANIIALYGQLIILIVSATLGTISYIYLEWTIKRV